MEIARQIEAEVGAAQGAMKTPAEEVVATIHGTPQESRNPFDQLADLMPLTQNGPVRLPKRRIGGKGEAPSASTLDPRAMTFEPRGVSASTTETLHDKMMRQLAEAMEMPVPISSSEISPVSVKKNKRKPTEAQKFNIFGGEDTPPERPSRQNVVQTIRGLGDNEIIIEGYVVSNDLTSIDHMTSNGSDLQVSMTSEEENVDKGVEKENENEIDEECEAIDMLEEDENV